MISKTLSLDFSIFKWFLLYRISESFDFLHLKSFKPLDLFATDSLTGSNFFLFLDT